MKIFLSWSGDKSSKIANALRNWLPMMLQCVEPWLSSTDIPRGGRWASEIENILEEVDYGIICLTKENLKSTWLNFEAGAISKNKNAKVIIFAIDVSMYEIEGPLTQFQAIRAKKEDLRKLITTLNSGTKKPMSEILINNLFNNLYPSLERAINEIIEDKAVSEIIDPPQSDEVNFSLMDGKLPQTIKAVNNIEHAPSKKKVVDGIYDKEKKVDKIDIVGKRNRVDQRNKKEDVFSAKEIKIEGDDNDVKQE